MAVDMKKLTESYKKMIKSIGLKTWDIISSTPKVTATTAENIKKQLETLFNKINESSNFLRHPKGPFADEIQSFIM